MEVLKFLNYLFQKDKKLSKPDPKQVTESDMNDVTSSIESDYYLENGYVVFTEVYHKKRGYCCGSGCRHCPFPKEIKT